MNRLVLFASLMPLLLPFAKAAEEKPASAPEAAAPSEKPAYLILCTEDAKTYSKALPKFVAHKEKMGFRVFVATEKDYGTGKTGLEQAAQVRSWLREFQKKTHAEYALLIGDTRPTSADLPAPPRPDIEKTGMDDGYRDLDGAWVDLYLNCKDPDDRTPWSKLCGGSLFCPRAMKQDGKPRVDELMIGRICLSGDEMGNSIYDLDRILEKTIRYENQTLEGKNLDWRTDAFSLITNYGAASWDDVLYRALEKDGGTYEYRCSLGWLNGMVPENVFDGKEPNWQLHNQTRRRGLVATMSHGCNRGGEGVTSQSQLLFDEDDRWPAAVGVSACSACSPADNCNLGQSHLRRDAVAAMGPAQSSNSARAYFLAKILTERCTVGESMRAVCGVGHMFYGDPSLRIVPEKGKPMRALKISPTGAAEYEERILFPNQAVAPLSRDYTLTNCSEKPLEVVVECLDAPWIALSKTGKISIAPGSSATVTAKTNSVFSKLPKGTYTASIRFRRSDGQADERRLAVKLEPITPIACYSFDFPAGLNRFPDLTQQDDYPGDLLAFWLKPIQANNRERSITPASEFLPCYAFEPAGRVGGALRVKNPEKPWTRNLPGLPNWRGRSVSLWFKVATLPQAGKPVAVVLQSPFSLRVDSAGALSAVQGGAPVSLGTIKPGEWHFVQFRSDIAGKTSKVKIDGKDEFSMPSPQFPPNVLTLGNFDGWLDELLVWSGELPDSAMRVLAAKAAQPCTISAPKPAPPAPAPPPAFVDFADLQTTFELATLFPGFKSFQMLDLPDWAVAEKSGKLSVKPGLKPQDIDFGGYDTTVLAKKASGLVTKFPLKLRIPVPAALIRIDRSADGMISFPNAGDRYGPVTRPLAPGIIRYTTDGSPVTLKSTVFSAPFPVKEGMKITARFFLYGEYPMAPVTTGSEFGLSHTKWKGCDCTGDKGALRWAGLAFDGRNETEWVHHGAPLPQFLAWDMGEVNTLTGLSLHTAVRDPRGRIADYAIFASDDGKTWTEIHKGTLENSPNAQRIRFASPCKTRYLKLETRSLHGGTDMIVTEIEAYSK